MSLIVIDEGRREDALKIKEIIEQGTDLEFVASGSTADVYKYNDLAVKVFNNPELTERQLLNMSWREVETMYRLRDSEYTPKLIAFEESKFVIMEYINGKPLAEVKDEQILKNLNQEVKAFKKQCIEVDIYPEDLSANNIMLKEDGKLVFIDFGYFSVGGIEDEDEEDDWNENWEDEYDDFAS